MAKLHKTASIIYENEISIDSSFSRYHEEGSKVFVYV